MFFVICEVEPLLGSQRGTQTPPKRVVVDGGVKHHLRDKYKNRANRRTTKPATAPRNAVASTGTVMSIDRENDWLEQTTGRVYYLSSYEWSIINENELIEGRETRWE